MNRGSRVALLGGALLAGCGGHGAATLPVPVADRPKASVDSLWAAAEEAFNRSDWSGALKRFDQVAPAIQAGDPRYLRLHFFEGEIQFAQGSNLQAVREFRRVADEQPESPLAPDALLRAGDAYADLWRRPELDPTYGETARGVYQEVVSRYGGTPAAARATMRLAALTEKFAEKDYRNALFYFRFKAWDSAILLLRGVVASYPRSSVVPDALERLVRAYQILGYQEDVKETCAYIVQYHPAPDGPRRFCPRDSAAAGAGRGPGGRR
jgi:outer membrane protein assembly factor BamD